MPVPSSGDDVTPRGRSARQLLGRDPPIFRQEHRPVLERLGKAEPARRTGPTGARSRGPPQLHLHARPGCPLRRARVPSSQVVEGMTFTSQDGVQLEGELRLPDEAPRASAVLCHPHPRHGGSRSRCPSCGRCRTDIRGTRELAMLAGFNFRGTLDGKAPTAAAGTRSVMCAARKSSACAWRPLTCPAWCAVRRSAPTSRCGKRSTMNASSPWCRSASRCNRKDVTLPALPPPEELRRFRRPVRLILAGDNDEYCPATEARVFSAEFADGRLALLEGTDHFLWRREREAATMVRDCVDEVFGRT